MAGKTKKVAANNLRAWREHRKLSQVRLAELAETTPSIISELESGHTQLSDKWLRRLAPVLGTKPGFLLDHRPEDIHADFLAAVDDIEPVNRETALRVLRSFARQS